MSLLSVRLTVHSTDAKTSARVINRFEITVETKRVHTTVPTEQPGTKTTSATATEQTEAQRCSDAQP